MRDPQAPGHIPPPAQAVDPTRGAAVKHTTALTEENLAHLRACTTCRIAWYRAGAWRPSCTDQRLGAAVLAGAGAIDRLSAGARAHVDVCIACQLAHRALSVPVPRTSPSPDVLRRLHQLLLPK
jgi:hypothetical protein